MSQDKNEQKQPAAEQAAPVEEVKTEQTAAPAEEQTTFTVTKEQMEKMEGLAKLVSDVNDKYLRLAAEYDNYRKRTTREKENAYADAKADTIKPFLDVLDNLDPHRQGMEMICKQFSAVLEKLGVAQIPAQDQPFDPQKHNAVMHVEDESVGENTIVEVFQQGYELGDKVLRFAMVKVAN